MKNKEHSDKMENSRGTFTYHLPAKIRKAANQHPQEKKYWLEKLGSGKSCKSGDSPIKSSFPEDCPPPLPEEKQGSLTFRFNPEVFSGLNRLTRGNDYILHVYMTACLTLLLARYTGHTDIIISTPIYRQDTRDELINTILPLRSRLTPDMTFKQLLQQVKDTITQAVENQNYPMELVAEHLNLSSSSARGDNFPLFDVGVAVEHIHDQAYWQRIKPDMIFSCKRSPEFLAGTVDFNGKRYSRSTIRRIVDQLQQLLEQALGNLDAGLFDIDILPPQEKEQLLLEFNHTAAAYPAGTTLNEIFAGQVEKTPNHTAVLGKEQGWSETRIENNRENLWLTYRQLNDNASRLAGCLIEKGAAADNIVGIMLERTVDMIIGILGILKAGCAYLPIDPEYPAARIDYMLADGNVRFLVKNSNFFSDYIKKKGIDVIFFDSQAVSGYSYLHHSRQPQPDTSLAYIIYTSGTTGNPKGVLIEHRNVVQLLFNDKFPFDFSGSDIWTLFHSFCFDFSVWEIFGALLYGGRLAIIPGIITRDFRRYLDILNIQAVTVLNQTPSVFYHLINLEMDNPGKYLALRYVIFGGEALSPLKLKEWQARYPHTRLINMYGITETTVHVTLKEITGEEIEAAVSNVGKPLPTLCAYVVDAHLNLAPIGAAGELLVGGAGVGRGYLNRPELTGEKFIANPFKPTGRLYRSGDLLRWLARGDLQYLGRIDHQVKIRGFRIEPGEIETRLLDHEEIREAVVVVQEVKRNESKSEHETCLCAFYTAGRALDALELREYLAGQIPVYMIPGFFIKVEKIPLTSSGKLDRNALPEPGTADTANTYEAPKNPLEKKLVEVWSQVLGDAGQVKIGINDNFFERGGDSIKAIQISARLREYGLDLRINDIFLYPVLRELAPYVKKIRQEIPQAAVAGEVFLTPIQCWFFDKGFTHLHHYNHAVMLYRREGFSAERLSTLFTKLVQHHDALRMVFTFHFQEQENNYSLPGKHEKVRQICRDPEQEGNLFDLEVFDFNGQDDSRIKGEIEQQADRLQAGIDLTRGPLVKSGLFKTNSGGHLLIVIHHLVMDGISWRILLEDIISGYKQLEQGTELIFPAKTHSFQHWAARLREYAAEMKNNSQELAYWQELETRSAEVDPLPFDHRVSRQKKKIKHTEFLSLQLPEEATANLLEKVNRAYNTEINEILLTALGMALDEWAGMKKISILLEGHGREPILEGVNISRTVGWFTSFYPLILDTSCWHSLSEAIKSVKETLRRIPNKGMGYGILRYLTPGVEETGLRFAHEPPISFNYLGQFGRETDEHLSPMPTGTGISPELEFLWGLDISGMITDNRLTLSFKYCPPEFDREHVELLVAGCRSTLLNLIRHCRHKKEEMTLSDFSAADLDEEELEDIFVGFEE